MKAFFLKLNLNETNSFEIFFYKILRYQINQSKSILTTSYLLKSLEHFEIIEEYALTDVGFNKNLLPRLYNDMDDMDDAYSIYAENEKGETYCVNFIVKIKI